MHHGQLEKLTSSLPAFVARSASSMDCDIQIISFKPLVFHSNKNVLTLGKIYLSVELFISSKQDEIFLKLAINIRSIANLNIIHVRLRETLLLWALLKKTETLQRQSILKRTLTRAMSINAYGKWIYVFLVPFRSWKGYFCSKHFCKRRVICWLYITAEFVLCTILWNDCIKCAKRERCNAIFSIK